MDLKQYFRKIRQVEAGLIDRFPLLVSLETPDGGKPGLVSEASREQAAKMIVEGRAVLASEEEKELYREQQADAKEAAAKAELGKRVKVAIITDRDLKQQIAAESDGASPIGK